jgi:ubiquinone/menaquinone biosynthesis C-methylase UbiE
LGNLPPHVAEMGAGSGLLTHFLAPASTGRYVALDLSPTMLAAARSRAPSERAAFVLGDAQRVPLRPRSLDAVIGVDFIHHLGDPRRALAEWRSAVRSGGRLVVLETNAHNPLILQNVGVEHEVRAFLNTRANLKLWAEDAGWEGVRVEPTPSFTPPGPPALARLLDLADRAAFLVWPLRAICALWLLTATAP